MWRLPSFAIWDCSRQQRSCSQSVRCSHFRRGARRRAAPKVTPRPSRPSTFGMAPRSTRSTPTVTRVSSITQCPQSHVRDSVHPHTRSHQPGVATRPWYRGNGDVQHRNAGPTTTAGSPASDTRATAPTAPLHHWGKKRKKKLHHCTHTRTSPSCGVWMSVLCPLQPSVALAMRSRGRIATPIVMLRTPTRPASPPRVLAPWRRSSLQLPSPRPHATAPLQGAHRRGRDCSVQHQHR